jgi:hypothetical protein
MLPLSTKGGGQCVATGPDVCKIPGPPPAPFTPTPFPNIGMVSDSDSTIATVLACNKQVVVATSKIPSSKGDEAGTLGGMVSMVNRSTVKWPMGSMKVFAKGKNVIVVTKTTTQNGQSPNIVGAQVSPSQTTVLAAL